MQPLILLDDIFQENHLNLLFLTSPIRKVEQWKGLPDMKMSETGGARAWRTDGLQPVRKAGYEGELRTREGGSERGSY
jgi:hypothetical protein